MAKRTRYEKKHGNKPKLSTQAKESAKLITDQVSPKGANKQQRKDIQLAIEKGIEQYKRQQKVKQHEWDKQRKKSQRHLSSHGSETINDELSHQLMKRLCAFMPWSLLLISWLGFAVFYLQH